MASSTVFCSWLLLCLLLLAAIGGPATVRAARTKGYGNGAVGHSTSPAPPPHAQPKPKCPKHQLLCRGSCTNSAVDELNCGSCGNDCTSQFVPYGACCAGKCVDYGYDNHHCGACNSVCPHNTMCCSQACTSIMTDVLNCGGCGNVCDTSYCCNGKCSDKKLDKQQCGCEPFCP